MVIEVVALVIIVATSTLLLGLWGAILAGLISIVAVFYTSRHLARKFSTITEDVIRTMSIDRTHRVDTSGPAELGRMARAVNRFADRVGGDIARESSERIRLASILNSMREGVVVVDDQGVIESANPAAAEMLGTIGDIEPGMLLTSLTNHPDVNRVVITAIDTLESVTAEVELFDTHRTLIALATPFPRPETESTRALLLLTDLTDIRRLDTTRREFVSNASHELRTPLAGIGASAETLQRGAIDDPVGRDQFLQLIRDDVDRMDTLIGEMLELSRLESGESPLELKSVEPRVLADAALGQFAAMAIKSELELASTVPNDLPLVAVDPELIGHVFTNLISNAIKWTEPGGKITVNGWADDDSVWFSVVDTGQGIEPAQLPHIFERFFKTDPARSHPGTGLGLSIARHIVEAHSGSISATSTPGEGSDFIFTVPVASKE